MSSSSKIVTWVLVGIVLLLTHLLATLGFFYGAATGHIYTGWFITPTPTLPVTPITVTSTSTPSTPEPPKPSILDQVRERGYLRCGVNGNLLGFSKRASTAKDLGEVGEGFYDNAEGLDADFCRVIAIAVFDTHEGKVWFKNLTSDERFLAVANGEVDVVLRNTTWTPERDVNQQVDFGPVVFYIPQTFMVHVAPNESVQSWDYLKGKTICVLPTTTHEANLEILHDRGIQFTPKTERNGVEFKNIDEVASAFFDKECDVMTSDLAQLSINLHELTQGNPDERYKILDDILITDEGWAPILPENDHQWREVVSYAIWATIYAEQLGISQGTLSQRLQSPTLLDSVFLGVDPTNRLAYHIGAKLGLDNEFARKIIEQMGNYGEIYNRNLVQIMPDRGMNDVAIEYFEGQVRPGRSGRGRLSSPPWIPDAGQIIAMSTITATSISPLKIRVGIAVDETGETNQLGREQLIALEIAVQVFGKYMCPTPEQTAQETPYQFCIELVYADAGSEEATAVKAFEYLIEQEVDIIIGPTYSQQAKQAHMVADEAGVLVLAVSNTADGIPERGEYIFRISAPVGVYAKYPVAAVYPEPATAVIVYLDNDDFTLSETRAFSTQISNSNYQLVDVITYTKSITGAIPDFAPIVNRILTPTKPGLVVISGRFPDSIAFIKKLKGAGYDQKLIAGNGVNVNAVFEACQQACDGVYVAQAFDVALKDLTPAKQEFFTAYQKAVYPGKPSQIMAQMFTAIQVIVKAAEVVTELPTISEDGIREALKQQFLSEMTFLTPLGAIRFDPVGEICQSSFYVAQIVNPDGKQGYFDVVGPKNNASVNDKGNCYLDYPPVP